MIISRFYRTVILGFCLLATPFFALAAKNAPIPLDKVVAIVNNSVVTQSQLTDNINILKQQALETGKPLPAASELRKRALDQAIGNTLQLQVAQRAKLTVTDTDLNNAVTRIAGQNHLTSDQLKDALGKEGISFSRFRDQIHDQMILHQVQQQALAGRVQVTDADVKAYLKNNPSRAGAQAQYHLEDLVIPLSESATQAEVTAATKQAADLLQQARANTGGLSQLAPSGGPLQYNDLQWRSAEQLPPLFAGQLNGLKAGDITGPIRAPNGLHLLRLIDVHGQVKSLTPQEAKEAALQQKWQEQVDKWVVELRKSAYIKLT